MSATTAKIAAGVAGGYLLGRTKKLRLALTLAGLLAGKKLAAEPKEIADRIAKVSPELDHLRGQLTDGLTGAAKDVALATAAARMESVTRALQGPADEASGQGAAANRAGGKKTAAKKAAAKKSTSATTSPPRKTTAKKTTAKKTTAKRSPAKKTAKKSTAKKSSSGSRR